MQRRGQSRAVKSVMHSEVERNLRSTPRKAPDVHRALRRTSRGCEVASQPRAASAICCRGLKGEYIADVFSGDGGVSKAIRCLGFNAKEIEILHGTDSDLTRPVVRHRLKQDSKNNNLIAVMFAPPCSSFSPARDRTSVIRTKQQPWGIDAHLLNAKDTVKVSVGNKCFSATFDVIRSLDLHRTPWILENPHASKCWYLPQLITLAGRPHVQTIVTDFCQFGTQWRKRTRFLCGNMDSIDLHRLQHTCTNSGICNRTGKQHFQLIGSNKQGIPWTRIAQPYPQKLCRALAHALSAHKHYNSGLLT